MNIFKTITDSRWFNSFIISVIILAGIVVGLETSKSFMDKHGELMHFIDQAILWIFVAEAAIKILSHGLKPWRYFKNPWNVFDFAIVAVCFLPINATYVAVLRLARILRVIRLVTVIPRLQVLVSGLLKSIPSMFYVTLLLALLFYVYAVIGVSLFRDNDPGHFGDLGQSLLTLFRVVTLEDWTDVMYTAILGSDAYPAQGPIPEGPIPHAFGVVGIIYFLSFVIVGSMVMINLFIGIVLTSLTEAQADQFREKMLIDAKSDQTARIGKSIDRIQNEIKELQEMIKIQNERKD